MKLKIVQQMCSMTYNIKFDDKMTPQQNPRCLIASKSVRCEEKCILHSMCVPFLPEASVRNTICPYKHIAINAHVSSRCAQERVLAFMQSSRYYFPILTKPGMCKQTSVNLSNVKFHENAFSGSRVATCKPKIDLQLFIAEVP
jgi:hypothetical protein